MSETALYRHYAADGKLLYVGISLSAVERLVGHRRHSSWHENITRIDIEWFPDRQSAAKAEALAIISESPAHNKHRNLGAIRDEIKAEKAKRRSFGVPRGRFWVQDHYFRVVPQKDWAKHNELLSRHFGSKEYADAAQSKA